MTAISVRTPTVEDSGAIAELLNEHSRALYGRTDLSEGEIREWFKWPHLWFGLAEHDGALVGYADVSNEDGRWFNIDLRALERDAVDVLLPAAESYIREHAREGAIVRGYTGADERMLAEAYEPAGFRVVRHSFQMEIALDGPPAPPRWPDGVRVREFVPGEEEPVYEAHMHAFEGHWGHHRIPLEEWRRYGRDREAFDPSLWFLAEDGDELAGVALCARHQSGDPEFGWVNVLGVRPAWRRRGLGGALLQHAFVEFARRGATRVGLGVDAENTTGAVRLYERAGMHVVRRTDTWEKTL